MPLASTFMTLKLTQVIDASVSFILASGRANKGIATRVSSTLPFYQCYRLAGLSQGHTSYSSTVGK
jgi:hypothetical protein